ncbi:MAG TPA: putative Ig domain-containing protein [Nitrosomonas sp.]|nr:putative Ig domain-containing protein [Nitrosomonas sp.]
MAITLNLTNNPPEGAVTINGVAQENVTLIANISTIADSDGLGALNYQWLRDNTVIPGATEANYVLGAADIGSQISVIVSYTDGLGTNENLTSDLTAIVVSENHPPILLAPLVDQAVEYDTVNWNYDTSASFKDEDALIFSATLVGGMPLPDWIQINTATGVLTGTPSLSNDGTYTLEITATDTHGLFVNDTLTLAVTAFDAGQLLVNTDANDTFSGTESNDTVTYGYAITPVTVSLALTGPQNTGGEGLDVLNNINNLIGSDYNDNLAGDSHNNVLDGGRGADILIGGLGNDSYIVNLASDIVTEKFNAGIDTVRSSVTYVLPGQVENLILMGTANINGTGNILANRLIGNAANNTLNGGVGADTAMGGLGNDIYFIDNANDLVAENINEGIDKINSGVTLILPENIEDLTLITTAAINGTGNDSANILQGNSAANVLNGGAGADTLRGGAGDDTYIVDNAGDIVTEALNAGIDTVNSNLTHTLKSNIEHLILSGTAAINGTGNALANTITGNAAANMLNGATGADTLIGGLGDDIYTVDNTGDLIVENLNEGIDKVNSSVSYVLSDNVENITLIGSSAINATGNEAANMIVGNSSSNQLIGGGGHDILNGAADNNTLTGGTGIDYFQFKSLDHITGGRIDTITDFNVVDDTIKLENSIFTVFSTIINPNKIPADQFRIGSQALDENDFIIYNSAIGALLYDADGNGVQAAVQFATLSTGLPLTNLDIHAI